MCAHSHHYRVSDLVNSITCCQHWPVLNRATSKWSPNSLSQSALLPRDGNLRLRQVKNHPSEIVSSNKKIIKGASSNLRLTVVNPGDLLLRNLVTSRRLFGGDYEEELEASEPRTRR